MTSIFGIAVSGLNAAGARINTASNNIANFRSTTALKDGQVINEPFTPQEVVQLPQTTGGTLPLVRDRQGEPVPVFSQDHPDADTEGFIQLPDIELASEFADILIAKNAFRANLSLIEAGDELLGALVDLRE